MTTETANDRNMGSRPRRRAAIPNWLKIGAVTLCGVAALTAVPDASAAAVTWTTTGVPSPTSVHVISPSTDGICEDSVNARFTDEEGSAIQTLFYEQANCHGDYTMSCKGFVPSARDGAIPVFNVRTCEWVA